MAVGLTDGARIAVIGAGPSGAAFASALLTAVRAFGRRAEMVLYDADGSERQALPALIDLKTRCRLASLGAIVTAEHAPFPIRGLLVHSAGRSAFVAPPSGGLWSLDSPAHSGRNLIKHLLIDAAVARGAIVRQAEVEAIEPMPLGEQRLRARGLTETFQCVVGAFGADSPLAEQWLFGRYRAPACRHGWHVRVSWPHSDEMMRLVIAPSPTIEALVFTPVGYGRASVLAIGRSADLAQADVIETLARLVRDGILPPRLSFEAPGPTRVMLGTGATRTLFAPGQLTVGAAAHGHLLDPGLYPALCSATRSARLLFTLGEGVLFGNKLELLQADLVRHAVRQPRFLRYARRAGAATPEFLASVTEEKRGAREGLSILGFGQLAADQTYQRLRWLAWRQIARRLLLPGAQSMAREERQRAMRPIVYLLDDDREVRSLISVFLTGQGHTVRAFDSEIGLIEVAAREPPSAIVFDIVLRWMDGLSLCRLLREHPSTCGCALIAISNLARKADAEAALDAGADAFLPKPIDFIRLARLLEPVLEKATSSDTTPSEETSARPGKTAEKGRLPDSLS